MKKNVSILLFVLLIGVVAYAFYLTNKSSSPQLGSLESTKVIEETSFKETTPKTDFDKGVELGEKALEKGEEWAENKKKKDSAKLANREEVLVYQIGMPKSSPEELWDTYKKLEGFGNVYLLKAAKHSYYLIKHEGYNKEQIIDHEAAAKEYLESADINEEIRIVDMMSLCSGNDEAELGRNEKVYKEKVPCYVCK